ncbi:hypothetical protein BC939DRAFT_36969 [Gamsiella multidivaricata]|uniref:uncharacterized protein n=1 Tax=Gamsiella multidivaricata TaxID=101098 RepID=UPI00221E51A7|nr:uncharacterized protein BC939DRAFT_36969 [Gamsiella multidivaricata]KAI7828872.1 hypothetical protein BC939DRAFT_36969 [Gamsiella multidivaricata]
MPLLLLVLASAAEGASCAAEAVETTGAVGTARKVVVSVRMEAADALVVVVAVASALASLATLLHVALKVLVCKNPKYRLKTST